MSTPAPARAAHLVGSIPAPDAQGAMELALGELDVPLRSLPDGETGERYHWIVHIIEAFRRHPDLELASDGRWSDYEDVPRFRVRRGHRLSSATLDFGHVAAYQDSRPAFERMRAERGRAELAFQAGVPGDLDMALFTFGPLGILRHRAPFREATVREIAEIHRLGGDEVVFQIEVPAELVFVARAPRPLRGLAAGLLARGIARLARESPEGARFGIHLCLGDMNHRALTAMTDAGPVVALGNAIAAAWPQGRPFEFLHVPFAAAEVPPPTDPAWYAPLRLLRLSGGTRLIAGFVHEDQPLEVQRELRQVIERAWGAPVDIATSCGLGRRAPDRALAALQRTAELTRD
ncbi:MAG TPA: hypothetical protein VHX88_02205 [Solirubrobacteraceae bacterium]|nr:hypothetical protein [Solirubrobacteraceae bacterium]